MSEYWYDYWYNRAVEAEKKAATYERVLTSLAVGLGGELRRLGYNCDCQAGGPDAVSIDLDWLESVAVRDVLLTLVDTGCKTLEEANRLYGGEME